MTKHLSSDEWILAAEGSLDAERRAHLSDCDVCRAEVASVALLLRRVANVDVPEPSPLFWEHFSARVQRATRQVPARRSGGAIGAWSSLVAAAASVVLAVWVVRHPEVAPPAAVEEQPMAVETTAADWDAVVALASHEADDLMLDLDGRADAVGIDELTPAERSIFVRLLEQQMEVTP